MRELSKRPSLDSIINEVDTVFGEEAGLARNVKLYLCQRYTGEKLKDIGMKFGIGESGVSQASRRIYIKISKDKKLKGKIAKVEKRLKLSGMKN